MMLSQRIRLSFAVASLTDASLVAVLRGRAAHDLTLRFGPGHWSGEATASGVVAGMMDSRVIFARRGTAVVATYRLSAVRPWAMHDACFTSCQQPLYLTDMAVLPDLQGRGIGRRCLAHAVRCARQWPANAIRLDAYDAAAGAGLFYEKCGFQKVVRLIHRGVPLVYYERLI
jgi:GNAT superfamily N-acetyltransferase